MAIRNHELTLPAGFRAGSLPMAGIMRRWSSSIRSPMTVIAMLASANTTDDNDHECGLIDNIVLSVTNTPRSVMRRKRNRMLGTLARCKLPSVLSPRLLLSLFLHALTLSRFRLNPD